MWNDWGNKGGFHNTVAFSKECSEVFLWYSHCLGVGVLWILTEMEQSSDSSPAFGHPVTPQLGCKSLAHCLLSLQKRA